jgi:hypothetical protein
MLMILFFMGYRAGQKPVPQSVVHVCCAWFSGPDIFCRTAASKSEIRPSDKHLVGKPLADSSHALPGQNDLPQEASETTL